MHRPDFAAIRRESRYDILEDSELEQTKGVLHEFAHAPASPQTASPRLSEVRAPRSPYPLQLSPLIQRTPDTARVPHTKSSKFSEKVYDGFTSEAGLFDEEDESVNHQSSAGRLLKSFHYGRKKWSDPAETLGLSTLLTVIIAGMLLMGLFIILGQAGPDSGLMQSHPNSSKGQSPHSHETLSVSFPFSPSHYLGACMNQTADGGATENRNLSKSANVSMTTELKIPLHVPYFSATEAEKAKEDKIVYANTDDKGEKICQKTLTYLLDDDFGFTFHLNAISLAIALANKDSRAFFIVDAQWDRGLWTDHFISLPDPGCQPPPPSEMVGCPRSSRHWILTSSIIPYHFTDTEFKLAFGDNEASDKELITAPEGVIPYQRQPIYEMARSTFTSHFILAKDNERLIHETKREIIDSQVWGSSVNNQLPPYVAVHVRKGDRHPFNPAHKFDYLPITDYINAINSTWARLRASDSKLPESPNVYLASDTPLTLDQFQAITPRSWRFFHLSQARPQNLSLIAHPHEYSQMHFHAHVLSERLGYTRGQVIDMAFLGGGWPTKDGTVSLTTVDSDKPLSTICTVSSNMCQFAALQLGWKEAFEESKWINLDLPLSKKWTGIEIPAPNTGDSDPNGGGHGAAHHSHG